jgi:hypothetical protein
VSPLPLARAVSAALAVVALGALCACAASTGPDDSPARKAAIQRALDARPVTGGVEAGRLCGRAEDWAGLAPRFNPHRYERVPGAHVRADGDAARIGSDWTARNPCWFVSWDAATGVNNAPAGSAIAIQVAANIGRYAVDKVGEDQTGAGGGKLTPYTAHFEPSALGKALIAAGVVHEPTPIDARASLVKNADGAWVVEQ